MQRLIKAIRSSSELPEAPAKDLRRCNELFNNSYLVPEAGGPGSSFQFHASWLTTTQALYQQSIGLRHLEEVAQRAHPKAKATACQARS
eukprot:2818078-Pleurochrysis_carterae.AAC.1